MKKKLLLITDVMALGGVEKVIVNTLNGIDYAKFEVTLFIMYKTEGEKDNIKKISRNVEIRYLFNNPINGFIQRILFFIFMFFPHNLINRFIVKENYDIIVTTKDLFAYPISVNKCTKVMWIHGGLEHLENIKLSLTNIIKTWYKKRTYSKFDRILLLTNSSKKIFCNTYKIDERYCYVHNNPINNNEIKFLSNESVTDYKFGSEIVIVCSCRLSIEKGVDRLLYACKKLLKERFRFHLIILGDGPERDNLENSVKNDAFFKEKVSFLGYKENPYKYLKKCNIYVSPSRTEGFSLSIAEAMILELSILSTDCHGPAEILDNGKYGLLVENSDAHIYEGLKTLLAKPELIDFYKAKSRERKDFFSFEENIRRFEKIVSSMIWMFFLVKCILFYMAGDLFV